MVDSGLAIGYLATNEIEVEWIVATQTKTYVIPGLYQNNQSYTPPHPFSMTRDKKA